MATGRRVPVAIKTPEALLGGILERAGELVAIPFLGLWDLFALAFDDRVVVESDGERAIEYLEREGEFVPSGLKKSAGKFGDCITRFRSRLRPGVPGGTPRGPQAPTDVLYLEP
jgi:hypothetical protein